jgi:hypothetical protein
VNQSQTKEKYKCIETRFDFGDFRPLDRSCLKHKHHSRQSTNCAIKVLFFVVVDARKTAVLAHCCELQKVCKGMIHPFAPDRFD